MKHTVINLYLFCFFSMASAQKIEQKTIYIEFKKGNHSPKTLKFYRQEEKGIVFNLYCSIKGSFLYKSGADTLAIAKLKKYKFSTHNEIEKLKKQWWKKNRKILEKKFGEHCCPPYDENYIFKTNLIEVMNDNQFIIYPVEWRNLSISIDSELPPKR